MPAPLAILATALSPDLRESARLAQSLGYPGLQLSVLSPALSLPSLARSAQRDLLKVLANLNVSILSLTTTAGKLGLAPDADIDKALAHFDQALKTAADLTSLSGQPIPLCLNLGPLPPPPPESNPAPPPIDESQLGLLILPPKPADRSASQLATHNSQLSSPRDEPFESTLTAALTALGQLADRYSVSIAFRSDLASFASLHAALAAVRCPHFGLDLDPVAILRDPWPLDQILSTFATTAPILHLRLKDALKGAAGRTQPTSLGQGQANLPELLQSLHHTQHNIALTVDPTDLQNRHSEAGHALAYLSSLL